MKTLTEIESIIREKLPEPTSTDGKWITFDQTWSKGLTQEYVDQIKAAGIPAFYNAGKRTWGMLAEEISR